MKRVRPYTLEDAVQFVSYWNFGLVKEPTEAVPEALAFAVNLPGASAEEIEEEVWEATEKAFGESYPEETFMRSEWHWSRAPRVVNGN